jgi:hypothetical protein
VSGLKKDQKLEPAHTITLSVCHFPQVQLCMAEQYREGFLFLVKQFAMLFCNLSNLLVAVI